MRLHHVHQRGRHKWKTRVAVGWELPTAGRQRGQGPSDGPCCAATPMLPWQDYRLANANDRRRPQGAGAGVGREG